MLHSCHNTFRIPLTAIHRSDAVPDLKSWALTSEIFESITDSSSSRSIFVGSSILFVII